jgi:hypothetical protein
MMIKLIVTMFVLTLMLLSFLLSLSHAAEHTLTWGASQSTPSAPVDGYNIYKAPTLFGTFVKIGSVDNQTLTYVDTQGNPGECYRVTAFNTVGESQPTNNGCSMVVLPFPPQGLSLR